MEKHPKRKMLFNPHKSFGFTLAEVLITLGIIGIVAAMTLPSIVNSARNKELEAAFKKQYSILSQAVMTIKTEDDLLLNRDNYSGDEFREKLAAQFKVTQNCGSINGNKGCILQEEDGSFSYYKTLTGKTLSRGYFDDGGFICPDGVLMLLEIGDQSKETGFLVTVDVNGYKKRPNRMGQDLFMFQITKDGRVLPMGAEDTHFKSYRETYCSYNSNNAYNGITCAYYAATDKDYFKNLPR